MSEVRIAARLAAAGLLLVALGCGATTTHREPEPRTEAPRKARRGKVQRGKASWYGRRFQGRKTASGERFDRRKLTAAHRKLRFGTRVRVTNLDNGKSVVVRINDRGPFGRGRIIDVSEAAARRLDMIRAGVVRVKVEVVGR